MLFYLNTKYFYFRLLVDVVIQTNPNISDDCWTQNPKQMRILLPRCTHQVTEVAQGVPGQLHYALSETAVVADEAGEDGGQTVAGSV